MALSSPRTYRFTFGPWNISMGADPFGPTVRPDVPFAQKVREYKKHGFDGIQLHDDDVVPIKTDGLSARRDPMIAVLDDDGIDHPATDAWA